MFNQERLLEARINRVKFWIKTDKLSHFQKRTFILREITNILESYYGGRFVVIYYILFHYLREFYYNIILDLKIFWWSKVLKLEEDQLYLRIINIKVKEIVNVKNN